MIMFKKLNDNHAIGWQCGQWALHNPTIKNILISKILQLGEAKLQDLV
jgi:hypothetical protein